MHGRRQQTQEGQLSGGETVLSPSPPLESLVAASARRVEAMEDVRPFE